VPDLQNRYNLPYRERDVVDAIRYQYHQNCEWDELPDAFPPPDDVQRHLHEWTEGSNRSVFELHEPGSFLSKVRVGLPDQDRGLTDADPGLDEEEAAIQQAIAASFEQAIPERSAQESEVEHTLRSPPSPATPLRAAPRTSIGGPGSGPHSWRANAAATTARATASDPIPRVGGQ
jgi:hypothetical protein